MPTPTVIDPKQLEVVLDAMNDVQTEGDRWHLAEQLLALVPQGSREFNVIVDKAAQKGVLGKMSATTLRLYRDTAIRWPKDKRVKGVGFTAHRESMVLGEAAAVKMLTDMATQHGPANVTVANVRKAVRIQQGKPAASTPKSVGRGPQPSMVVDDLVLRGGKLLIDTIGNMNDADRLDKVAAGLSKVQAHVDNLRAKAARAAAAKKAPAVKKAPAPAAPKPSNGAAAKPAASAPKKKVGDLRNL